MADRITLTVPAKYADDFRAALVEEIATDAKFGKEHRAGVLAAAELRENTDLEDADLRSNMRLLRLDAELLAEVGFDGEGDIDPERR